ncbi:MAG TPA: WecB/TagA/CpsF family glycosyltransferase [Anaerolineaceae bacterium]|nr:WecB/TagA/CpsF family glycosyltransferase [Anaerolineaceae bacterium]
MSTPVNYPYGNILGVHVNAICMQDALDALQFWISTRQPHYVCVTPAFSVLQGHDHPDLRKIYNSSGLTTPDGAPVTWLLKWQGFKCVERVYGPDFLLAACQRSIQLGWKHYFYGGTSEVQEALKEKLTASFQGLIIVGAESPPFRPLTPEEDEETIARISAARPDILWVGLGAPRQDRWMASHLDSLGLPVLVGVGAAFDFVSGCKPQAPIWMRRNGLEWLFRLASEPKRLWRRYLLGNPRFMWLYFLQTIGVLNFE